MPPTDRPTDEFTVLTAFDVAADLAAGLRDGHQPPGIAYSVDVGLDHAMVTVRADDDPGTGRRRRFGIFVQELDEDDLAIGPVVERVVSPGAPDDEPDVPPAHELLGRIVRALDLALEHQHYRGAALTADQKDFVIDRMVRMLAEAEYPAFVDLARSGFGGWNEGRPPRPIGRDDVDPGEARRTMRVAHVNGTPVVEWDLSRFGPDLALMLTADEARSAAAGLAEEAASADRMPAALP
ncbi:hypothetical protein [Saccharothrix sp. HUAS TT1]|uniref:hypothetical protein n=1 Tax=unclassified Saccharothrix TaxID=2593673 RepID=UPI00345BE25F